MTLADFELLKVIGRGTYGKVMQVRRRDTGEILAMRVLKKENIFARNDPKDLQARTRTQPQPLALTLTLTPPLTPSSTRSRSVTSSLSSTTRPTPSSSACVRCTTPHRTLAQLTHDLHYGTSPHLTAPHRTSSPRLAATPAGYAFHTPAKLYYVLNFCNGGDLYYLYAARLSNCAPARLTQQHAGIGHRRGFGLRPTPRTPTRLLCPWCLHRLSRCKKFKEAQARFHASAVSNPRTSPNPNPSLNPDY